MVKQILSVIFIFDKGFFLGLETLSFRFWVKFIMQNILSRRTLGEPSIEKSMKTDDKCRQIKNFLINNGFYVNLWLKITLK